MVSRCFGTGSRWTSGTAQLKIHGDWRFESFLGRLSLGFRDCFSESEAMHLAYWKSQDFSPVHQSKTSIENKIVCKDAHNIIIQYDRLFNFFCLLSWACVSHLGVRWSKLDPRRPSNNSKRRCNCGVTIHLPAVRLLNRLNHRALRMSWLSFGWRHATWQDASNSYYQYHSVRSLGKTLELFPMFRCTNH